MSGQRVLLVEGKTDRRVIERLCTERRVPTDGFETFEHAGYQDLLDKLPTRIKAAIGELRHLGIVIDADRDAVARWERVAARLEQFGCAPPALPSSRGTTVECEDGFVASTWIMPDNESPGALEDFLYPLVPESDPLFSLAVPYVAGVPENHQPSSPGWARKAQLCAWLAIKPVPGLPFGTAMTAGYLDASRPGADEFVEWLRSSLDV